MTASEILNIVVTVGLSQLGCDLLAKWLVYNKEPYQRACGSLQRAKWKLDKAEVDAKKNDKHAKRLQRSKDDYGEFCSDVARRHTGPGMISSIFFVILLRILGAEHKGNVMAILPFVPFTFFTRITARGLDWSNVPDTALEGIGIEVKQATSFLFIYLLAGLSVKYFVNKTFGTQPPAGADRGIMTVLESRQGQRLVKSLGIDPEELLLK
jgi:hypothetical protein